MIATMREWESFDQEHPAPTFFARPAFARALHDAFPRLSPAPVAVQIGGDEYLVPAVRSRNALRLSSGVGLPLGAYSAIADRRGGVVREPILSSIVAAAAREFDAFEFTGWPLGDQPSLQTWAQTPLTTAVIDCGGGLQSSLRSMRGVTRRMAAQAARRGVQCVRSDADDRSLRRYYDMLEESSKGWGYAAPTIPLRLLSAVFTHGREDAELWFAMLEDVPIAGAVVLFGSQELFFWSAAMRRTYSRYRPSNALNVCLIERACERGVRWYNLGASEGLAGVERFKHDLGAADVSYRRVQYQSRAAELYRRVRGGLRAGMVG